MEDKYDSDDFYVPASDARGHSVRKWFRWPEGMEMASKSVINSKKFPYRDTTDLIRHAVKRHIDWLSTLEEVPSVIKEVDAIKEILKDEQWHNEYEQTFDSLENQVKRHTHNNSGKEAKRLVNRVFKHISGMPEGYWKDHYLDTMHRDFGPYIDKTEET